jgi:DNA-binding PadR family transcriptional regulator
MTSAHMASQSENAQGTTGLRPMTSQFNWVLLGLVIKRPGYGYELAKRFERDYGDVLPLRSASHTYAGLNELERRGLIEAVPLGVGPTPARQDRQPKQRYRATPRGRQGYRMWLLTQIDEPRRNWLLFVRLLGVLAPEPEVALEIIERYRLTLLMQAPNTLTTSAREDREEPIDEVSRLVLRLIDEEQRLAAGRMLDWVDFAQREFEALVRKQA